MIARGGGTGAVGRSNGWPCLTSLCARPLVGAQQRPRVRRKVVEMSLNDLLEAALLHYRAECEAVSAELRQIMITADSENLVETEPAIRAVLKRLKEANDRLQDATTALRIVVQTRSK